ncbi:Uncharacterised protein [Providencia alcalifaciens]|nr:Uncharacterised protein [Providencia alcalifaciens]
MHFNFKKISFSFVSVSILGFPLLHVFKILD